MKVTILSLTLALSAAVSAIPAVQAVPEFSIRDTPERTIDCSYCTGMLDFCFEVRRHVLKPAWTCDTDHDAEWSHSRSGRLQADLP